MRRASDHDFEVLEERLQLSADPVLTVITHGFQLKDEAPQWAMNVAAAIKEKISAVAEVRAELTSETTTHTVRWDNGFLFPTTNDSNLTLQVDWAIPSRLRPSWPQAADLAAQIESFVNDSGQQWDVIFIGHSRGAIFNSRVIANLQGVGSIDYLEMITLDATASLLPIHRDDLPIPEARYFGPRWVPKNVDRAIGYDDDHSLLGVPGPLLGMTITGSLTPFDSFDLRPLPTSNSKVTNWHVGSLIDDYLEEDGITGCEIFESIVFSIGCNLAVWRTNVTYWPIYQSLLSHINIHGWFLNRGFFDLDFGSFLAAKDPADPDIDVPGAEDLDAPLEENKPPVGLSGGIGAPLGNQGSTEDDYSDFFDAATAVGAGAVQGRISSTHDHDWFQFVASENGNLEIEVVPLDSEFRPYVRLHWDTKTLIDHNTSGGSGFGVRIPYGGAESGRSYFIDVTSASGTIGNYYLKISQPDTLVDDPAQNMPPVTAPIDDFPSDFASAAILHLDAKGNAVMSGEITEGDDDWFQITAQETGQLVVEVNKPYSSLDSHLRLHNAGTLVAEHNDRIQRSVTEGESYWLHVRAGDENGRENINEGEDPFGRYVLHISQPDDVAGSSGTDGPPGPLPGWGGVRGVTINLDNGNGSSVGSIDDGVEADWFQIDEANQGFMQIVVDGVNDDLTEFVTAFRSNGGGIDTDSGESVDGQANVCFNVAQDERIIAAVSSHNGRSTGAYTINVSQPPQCPDDDHPDFGEPPRDLAGSTAGGNGFAIGRIETDEDDDWFEIPVEGNGFLTIQVDQSNSSLVSFLELNNTGDSSGFFESDDGRDGVAQYSFIPPQGTSTIWVKVSSVDGTQGPYALRYWRSAGPNDDHPDSGGAFTNPRTLPAGGQLIIAGSIEHPGDNDAFRVEPEVPGPVAIQVISLTEGFQPFMDQSWEPADSEGDTENTDGGDRPSGRTFHIIDSDVTHVNFDISYSEDNGANGAAAFGDYVVYVWQPDRIDDFDPDTVGIEATPIWLNGSDSGSISASLGDPGLGLTPATVDLPQSQDVVSRWPLDEDDDNKEVRTDVVGGNDLSNTGVAVGPGYSAPNSVGADFRNGADFEKDGTSYLRIEDTAQTGLDITSAMTISTWFKPESLTAAGHALVTKYFPGGHNSAYYLGVRGDQTLQWVISQTGDAANVARVISSTQLVPGNWYHVVAVFDPSNAMKIYLDAVEDGSETSGIPNSIANTNASFVIGASENGSGAFADGLINDPIIWNRALSSIEVTSLFNSYSAASNETPASDIDVFQAVAASNRPITFRTDKKGTFLRIYDASGQSIATDQNSGPNETSEITLEADGGELFYTEVSAFNGRGNGRYSLLVSQDPDDHPDAPIFQPKGKQTQDATEIVLNEVGFGEAFGEIESDFVGDHDMFRVYSTEPVELQVTVTTTDDMLDTFLRVYDSHGSVIAVDDDGGDLRNSTLTFQTFMDETYLVEVSGYSDNSVGKYHVTVQQGPLPRQTFVGTYDDFSTNEINDTKWRVNRTTIWDTSEQQNGQAKLVARGNGASVPVARAELESRANVEDGIELDFVTALGKQQNLALLEVTDGTNFLRVQMSPDGNDMVLLNVTSNGYAEISSSDLVLTPDTSYHLAISEVNEDIVVSVDFNVAAMFTGPLFPESYLRAFAQADGVPVYDNFNDGVIDANLWQIFQDPTGQEVEETGGSLILYGTADSNSRSQTVTIPGEPGGRRLLGAKWTQKYLDGPGESMNHYAQIGNGQDRIRIFSRSQGPKLELQLNGIYGNGTVATWDQREATFEINEVGSDIHVTVDGTLEYVISNKSLQPATTFHAFANHFGGNADGYGDKRMAIDDVHFYYEPRFARLELDNVMGTLGLAPDAELISYDTFDDGEIDFDKFQIAGTVDENDGRITLPLFRDYQPVHGYITSAGIPNGTNLRGFSFRFDRTAEPKNLGSWDIFTRIELTNGSDTIRIGGLHQQSFFMETSGSYGVFHVDVPVPSEEIPDGPFEIREHDGNIEVLHNHQVKLTVPNQTVRSGSYFVFQTHGNPLENTIENETENFDASIDFLKVYVEPSLVATTVDPSLAAASDTGPSSTDHHTSLSTVDIEWGAAAAGSRYQWRLGRIDSNGEIVYGSWSALLDSTSVQIDNLQEGLQIVSVRPINPDGLAGQPSSRGFVIDATAPRVVSVSVGVNDRDPISINFGAEQLKVLPWSSLNKLTIQTDEPIAPISIDDIELWGTNVGDYRPFIADVQYDSSNQTIEITLSLPIGPEKLLLVVKDEAIDIAGNSLDGEWINGETTGSSGDGTQGGEFVFRIDVLPGDADRNGTNSLNDLQILATNWQQSSNDTNRFADFDGSGVISLNDLQILATNWQKNLPMGDPARAAVPVAGREFDRILNFGFRNHILDKIMARWNDEEDRIGDAFERLLDEMLQAKRKRVLRRCFSAS